MRAIVLSIINEVVIHAKVLGEQTIPTDWVPGMIGIVPVFEDKVSADAFAATVGKVGVIFLGEELETLDFMKTEGNA